MDQEIKGKGGSVWDEFTGKYELSKTLRFELKPIGETAQMLQDNDVFEKDRIRKEKYENIKPWFDRLHREFVKDALSDISLSGLEKYIEKLNTFLKEPKNKTVKDNFEREEKRLRVEITDLFDKKAKQWGENLYPEFEMKPSVNMFFEEDVFEVLKKRYGKEKETFVIDENGKEISLFGDWKGFTGYFTKFFETRKNFYKSDGTSTAIATRIINQNLRRFCANLFDFEVNKKKIDFSEVEEKFDCKCQDVFRIEFYNKCVLQDGIDLYNKILGGETRENGEKLRGINEMINEYRQNNKGEKPHFLKKLDKQILGEKEKMAIGIPDDNALLAELKSFYEAAEEKTSLLKTLIADFVKNNDEYELGKVYLSKEALNTISHKWTANAETFEKTIFETLKLHKAEYDALHLPKDPKLEETEDGISFPSFIKMDHVKAALDKKEAAEWRARYYKDEENDKDGMLSGTETGWEQFLLILNFEFFSLFSKEVADEETGKTKTIGYDIYKILFKQLLGNKNFVVDLGSKAIIKDFSDNVKWIYQMGKYLAVEKKRAWLDKYDLCDRFYVNPETGYLKYYDGAFEKLVKKYDRFRNYLTKKAYGEKKWKLNFENPTLADGFDKNKESDNYAVILRKNNEYYLALMKRGSNKIFDDRNKPEMCSDPDAGAFEKMIYKQIADASKDIHNLVMMPDGKVQRFTKLENKEKYWTKEIIEIKKKKSYAKDNFDRKDFETFVDYMKECAKGYWPDFLFQFTPTKNYRTIKDFTDEISYAGYKISFESVSEEYITKMNEEKKLYLFQIKNKDWNLKDGKQKTTLKNLQSLYFEHLFSVENISKKFPFKLNGQAEIFFRPKTSTEKLGTKMDKNGKTVVNHRRFAEDKMFFHCPMTMNRGKNDGFYFNRQINNFLAENPDIHVIGVDRGEKHLAYYSVVNQKQEILESRSLNIINGKNYQEILKNREDLRRMERQSWNDVESIKDLKKGYVSQVVRVLADLIIRYNAIVVLEDLNMRFKQVRGGIERSVYQQLEKALINKLNFLVEKNEMDPSKAGNLLKAYQLTAPFTTFREMGKQTGLMFYTQAEYTSTTDPLTGFRKNVYISNSASQEKIKSAIEKFEKIGWDGKGQSYFFTYNPIAFVEPKYKEKTFSKEWTIYANVLRLRRERDKLNHWISTPVNPNKMLEEIFDAWKFENPKAEDMKEEILRKIEDKELIGGKKIDGRKRSFEHAFIYAFNQILNIRNSSSKDDVDFIVSPVPPRFATNNGYGSAQFLEFGKKIIGGENQTKEEILKDFNGDANGAYNIARKGIMILERIKKNPEKPELWISKKQWDEWLDKNSK